MLNELLKDLIVDYTTMERVYLTNDSWYVYIEDFLHIEQDHFESLWKLENDIEHHYIKMFGKTCQVPRKQGLYSECDISYNFSGIKVIANSIPIIIKDIVDKINFDCFVSNAIFVNWYKDGSDYISAHSDDERDLLENSDIVSLSFGATRTFRIRSKSNKNDKIDFELKHGTLFIMGGKFQKEFTHEVPKKLSKRHQSSIDTRRINMTLRNFKT